MPAKSPLASSLRRKRSPLAGLLSELATVEGFGPTCLPDVRLMRSSETHPSSPVSYDPSIVIIAQGRKRGRLGARNYLGLAVPLPFECETFGTPEEPMLGMAVRVNPATVAELLLEQDAAPQPASGSPDAIAATPLTPELSDAALRLAKCLRSPVEARILGPQIIREMTYRSPF